MLKKNLFACVCLLLATTTQAQKALDVKEAVKEIKTEGKDGWKKTGGLGLDFASLSLINPRVGAGDNRLGVGGLLNYNANLKKNKFIWDTRFGLQLSVTKIGDQPLAKANDVLQITTQVGYALKNKWYFAGLADLQTQFLPTYGRNFLREQPVKGGPKEALTGKFFAPAIIKFAPGAIYKYDTHLKFLISPLALRAVIVNDDSLAKSGKFFPQPDPTKIARQDIQLGGELRVDYNNKFFNDKIVYSTTLDLYSNYRREPQNVAIEWYHSLDFIVFKGLSVNFKTDWFYDHNILVQRGGDPNNLGRDVFFRNALLLKFNRIF